MAGTTSATPTTVRALVRVAAAAGEVAGACSAWASSAFLPLGARLAAMA